MPKKCIWCGHSVDDHSQVNVGGFPCFKCDCPDFQSKPRVLDLGDVPDGDWE